VLEVVRISDIILEVLDARFIEETRNLELEDFIKRQRKKIIYILNKADLVDVDEVTKKIELENIKPYVFISCKKRAGATDLRKKIKIEVKRLRADNQIAKSEKKLFGLEYNRAQVGVIGYPNTGKSSLINLLIGRSSAKTAAESGFTKGIQKLRFTNEIQILDTPGVIPEKELEPGKSFKTKHTQIGVRTYDKVKEPEFVVLELMKKYPCVFENFYGIDADGDSEILINELGQRLHFFLQGGKIDIDRTARKILRDWQEGKIRV